jgi:hypothetical protein
VAGKGWAVAARGCWVAKCLPWGQTTGRKILQWTAQGGELSWRSSAAGSTSGSADGGTAGRAKARPTRRLGTAGAKIEFGTGIRTEAGIGTASCGGSKPRGGTVPAAAEVL